MQNQCISGMPQGIPMQFLLNSGESHVVVTSFTHIQFFAAKFNFLNFTIAGKCSKLFKISLFMQNQCISGMPHAIFCSTVVKVMLL